MKKLIFKILRLLPANFAVLLCLLSFSNCKKFIEVEAPYTSINSENVYSSDATAIAVVTNIYAQMINDNQGGLSNTGTVTNLVLPTGLSADELTVFNLDASRFQTNVYRNSLSAINLPPTYWQSFYLYIFGTNAAIAGLANNDNLNTAVQKQLLGETKFLRAFFYFYLVNLYGDIPLALSTDFKVNTTLNRTPKAQVYDQIILDLKEAQALLSENFRAGDVLSGTTERVRPTKWAATALLARVYLYTSKYQQAIEESTKLIENSALFGLDDLDKVFLKNRKESIWQLQPVRGIAPTGESYTFKLTSIGPDASLEQNVHLSDYIYKEFETGDKRKDEWVGTVTPASGIPYHYSYKYKVGRDFSGTDFTEYFVVFRLAEQHLIRSEAKAYLNNFDGAKSDLNLLRHRAGLKDTPAASNLQSMLSAILQERKVELFTEWGHRWFDLKRWPDNTLSTVMTSVCQAKGGIWSNNWALYPIPISELEVNRNLVQNTGY